MDLNKKKYNNNWGFESIGDKFNIEDTDPVFTEEDFRNWFKLLFYPDKFLFYIYLIRAKKKYKEEKITDPFRILQLNCKSGSSLVDLKKIFGREVEIYGVDSTRMQVDVAKKRVKKHETYVEIDWWDESRLDFPTKYFDAIFSFDRKPSFCFSGASVEEINRVLKQKGKLFCFSANNNITDNLVESGFRLNKCFGSNFFDPSQETKKWPDLIALFEFITLGRLRKCKSELMLFDKNRDSYGVNN